MPAYSGAAGARRCLLEGIADRGLERRPAGLLVGTIGHHLTGLVLHSIPACRQAAGGSRFLTISRISTQVSLPSLSKNRWGYAKISYSLRST